MTIFQDLLKIISYLAEVANRMCAFTISQSHHIK